MKSEERHKLKTNELADSLMGLREWVKANASQVVGGVLIIMALIVAVKWWFNSRAQAGLHRAVNLQQQMLNVEKQQWAAVAAAQDPGAEKNAAMLSSGYNVMTEVASLEQLARKAGKADLGATALLAEADATRSRLLYSTEPLDEAAREDILKKAEELYNKALSQSPDSAYAVGYARMGLGLIAEDRGDKEAAKKEYEAVIGIKDGLLKGTVWPERARQRLNNLDELSDKMITFPEAPAEEPTATEATPPAEEAAEPAPAESTEPAAAESKD